MLNLANPKLAETKIAQRIVLPNGKMVIGSADVPKMGDFNRVRSDIESALSMIDTIKKMSTNFNKLDPRDTKFMKSTLLALKGRLREPFLGPGAVTQQEYDRLSDAVGDPTKWSSLASLELNSIYAIESALRTDLAYKAKFIAGAPEWPESRKDILTTRYLKMKMNPREAVSTAEKEMIRNGWY
jgi:hypothetical protein